jgi:site-specific DNA recombinase
LREHDVQARGVHGRRLAGLTVTIPGAIYCRISNDPEGLALGVERQREDCIELARERGIEVPPERILIENDRGASTRSKKARPEYDHLRQMVLDGTIKAVVFYSNSRLTRRPKEFEDWIELHEKTRVELVSKVSGNDDLGTADGRMVARIKASVDAAEAERISERVRRSFEQRRASGKVATGGPRPFGFAASASNPVVISEEAEAIRHACRLVLSGATLGQVATEWTERGLKPIRAASWTRDSVRSVLRSPRVAGLVAHKGEVVGKGDFEAIVDRVTWEAVVQALDHGPKPTSNARVHLLAGFVFCGVCGNRMYSSNAAGRPNNAYRCVKQRQGCGSVKRNKEWLDTYVDGYVRGILSEEGGLSVEADDGPVPVSDIETLEQRIAELRERHVADEIDGEDFFPLLSGLRAKLNEARKAEAEVVKRATQKAALSDPIKVWEDGSLLAKRALLADLVQGIYVKPVGRIGRAPIPVDSVEIVPT